MRISEWSSDVGSSDLQFATRFYGFSIGSNDLTQLVLGVDRDSGFLVSLFDERDEAVTRMIAEAIRTAHAAGIKIGLCVQAPSNHPDFAAFLFADGINSISLNSDSFVWTAQAVSPAVGISRAAERRDGKGMSMRRRSWRKPKL